MAGRNPVITARVAPDIAQRLDVRARCGGMSRSQVIEEALDIFLPERTPEADLIEELCRHHVAVTVDVQPDLAGGPPTIGVTPVAREGKSGAPGDQAQERFERLVEVQAGQERGRVAVELVAQPTSEWSGVRIFLCIVPAHVATTVTVNLADLAPLTAGAETAG